MRTGFRLFTGMICAGLLSACNKTDKGQDGPGNWLTGRWEARATHTVVTTPQDPSFRLVADTAYPAGRAPYLAFKDDGTYTGTLNFSSGLVAHGTYELTNTGLTTTTIWSSTVRTVERYDYAYTDPILVLQHVYGDTNLTYTQWDTLRRQ